MPARQEAPEVYGEQILSGPGNKNIPFNPGTGHHDRCMILRLGHRSIGILVSGSRYIFYDRLAFPVPIPPFLPTKQNLFKPNCMIARITATLV